MVRRLIGAMQRPGLAGRVVKPDGGTRLHRVRNKPVVPDPEVDTMPCPGKGRTARRRVAQAKLSHDIAAAVLHTRRTGFGGRHHIGHAVPRRVVDDDAFGGLLCRRQTPGHRERDRLADIPHDPSGQEGHGERANRPPSRRVDGAHERQIADTVVGQVLPGNDPRDAFDTQRRRDVQPAQTRRRLGRANDDAMKLAREGEIVREPPPPPQQPAVLKPAGELRRPAAVESVSQLAAPMHRRRRDLGRLYPLLGETRPFYAASSGLPPGSTFQSWVGRITSAFDLMSISARRIESRS